MRKNRVLYTLLFLALITPLIILLYALNLNVISILILASIPTSFFAIYFAIKDYKFFLRKIDESVDESIFIWKELDEFTATIGSWIKQEDILSICESAFDATAFHDFVISFEFDELVKSKVIEVAPHMIEDMISFDNIYETDPTEVEEYFFLKEEEIARKFLIISFDRPSFQRRLNLAAYNVAS